MENQPGEFWLEGLFLGWIEEDLEYIKFLGMENKAFQEIREANPGDPDLVILCRQMLFENARQIESLTERIDDVRSKIKAIAKTSPTQEP